VPRSLERREFLKGATPASQLSSLASRSASQRALSQNGATQEAGAISSSRAIPRRPLGRTGENVSMIGLGRSHIAKGAIEESESIRLVQSAIDHGITFLDNSWDYNNGQSEIRMGKALQEGYRHKAFLMTKLDGRTKQEARSGWMNRSADCRPITLI
jgi:hypothetical protein